MVVVLVLVMIRLPLSALKEGVGDILLGAPPDEMQTEIKDKVTVVLAGLSMKRYSVRMVKVGRHIFVSIFILLPEEGVDPSITDMDGIRGRIDEALKGLHPEIVADTMFTGADANVPDSSEEDR